MHHYAKSKAKSAMGQEQRTPGDGVEQLAARAQHLKETLSKNQAITDNMIHILGSFDHRLSSLEAAMRPTQVESKIIQGPREDLTGYLAAMDQLQSNIEFFSHNHSFKSSDGALNHSRSLLAKAMSKLEEEFKQVLTQHSKPVEPARLLESLPNSAKSVLNSSSTQGSGSHPKRDTKKNEDASSVASNLRAAESASPPLLILIPPRIVPQLREMAQRLVGAGYHQQCSRIYRDVRASSLDQSLRKLGVEKLTKEDVQKMQWEVLEGKIGNWIQFMRIAVKILFAAERKICDQILHRLDPYREKCFAELSQIGFSMLLGSGEAIVKSKKSPEKLFVLLDMYETIRDLMPEIESIFSGEASSHICESAMALSKRLAQTAQETFDDFLEAVEKDATKTPVLDGTVHPLTSYVINYVKFLFDYQITLKQLFGEDEKTDKLNSHLAEATTKIIFVLQSNLDGKSKQYKDPALTQLFLMNNIHYIVRSVRRSEAKDLLGDDWIQRHRRTVQQHATAYQRAAWGKVLQCLSGQGLSSSSGGSGGLTSVNGSNSGISKAGLKERFKTFNSFFEELHQRQTQWTIPDTELREAVRLAIAEVLLPAYRSFLKRFSAILESGKNPQKYIKYMPEDLERLLGEFFEGKSKFEQKR